MQIVLDFVRKVMGARFHQNNANQSARCKNRINKDQKPVGQLEYINTFYTKGCIAKPAPLSKKGVLVVKIH